MADWSCLLYLNKLLGKWITVSLLVQQLLDQQANGLIFHHKLLGKWINFSYS